MLTQYTTRMGKSVLDEILWPWLHREGGRRVKTIGARYYSFSALQTDLGVGEVENAFHDDKIHSLPKRYNQTAQVTLPLARAPPHPKPNTSLTTCLLFIRRRADFGEDMFCAVKHLLGDARQTTVVTSRARRQAGRCRDGVDMDIGRSWMGIGLYD